RGAGLNPLAVLLVALAVSNRDFLDAALAILVVGRESGVGRRVTHEGDGCSAVVVRVLICTHYLLSSVLLTSPVNRRVPAGCPSLPPDTLMSSDPSWGKAERTRVISATFSASTSNCTRNLVICQTLRKEMRPKR